MSAFALRDSLRARINTEIAAERSYLSDLNEDDASVHRRQGVVRGLTLALDFLANIMKDSQ